MTRNANRNMFARFLDREKVNLIRWPGKSPDLNPIEHLRGVLERRVRTRNFTNEDDFFKALQREGLNIPEAAAAEPW